MQNEEKKIQKQNSMLDFLSEESDSIKKILSGARDYHFKNLNENLKQFLNFNIKLGELSLIIGAAIGPVIIVTNKEISQPVYVFLAIIIYLSNGIYAILKAKDTVEKQLDAFSPSMLHKLESDIYPLEFSIDKLRFDLENQEYIDEFFRSRSAFVEDNTEIEIPKKTIDFTLDILTLNFVIASLLLVRTIWPFSTLYYWAFFVLIIIVVIVLLFKSFRQAKERAVQNAANTKKLNDMKRAHIEWQKEMVLKMKNREEK